MAELTFPLPPVLSFLRPFVSFSRCVVSQELPQASQPLGPSSQGEDRSAPVGEEAEDHDALLGQGRETRAAIPRTAPRGQRHQRERSQLRETEGVHRGAESENERTAAQPQTVVPANQCAVKRALNRRRLLSASPRPLAFPAFSSRFCFRIVSLSHALNIVIQLHRAHL